MQTYAVFWADLEFNPRITWYTCFWKKTIWNRLCRDKCKTHL